MSWERDNYVVGTRSYVVGRDIMSRERVNYVVGTKSYVVGTT